MKDADVPFMTTSRLETFSDGVFAIVITLLVLDLHVPGSAAVPPGGLGGALVGQWPNYVAFVISFLLVGVVWVNHHTMFHFIRRTDHTLIVLNLLLLLCVAVIPFSAAVLAEYIEAAPVDQRVGAQVYAGVLVIGGVFFNLLWWYPVRAGLCASPEEAAELYGIGRHWALGPLLYAVALVLCWVSVPLSLALYGALILWFGISGPWLSKLMRR